MHTWSMLRSFTSLIMMSSFSIFTSAQGQTTHARYLIKELQET